MLEEEARGLCGENRMKVRGGEVRDVKWMSLEAWRASNVDSYRPLEGLWHLFLVRWGAEG